MYPLEAAMPDGDGQGRRVDKGWSRRLYGRRQRRARMKEFVGVRWS
jgi:hypothetical protein